MKADLEKKDLVEELVEERMAFMEVALIRDKNGDVRLDIRIKPNTFDSLDMWGLTVAALVHHISSVVPPVESKNNFLLMLMGIIINEVNNPSLELGENHYEDDIVCDGKGLN